MPKLKSPVCPTIYLEGEYLDAYLSQDCYCFVKCKQPCPGFELELPSPFSYTDNHYEMKAFSIYVDENRDISRDKNGVFMCE